MQVVVFIKILVILSALEIPVFHNIRILLLAHTSLYVPFSVIGMFPFLWGIFVLLLCAHFCFRPRFVCCMCRIWYSGNATFPVGYTKQRLDTVDRDVGAWQASRY